MTIYEQFLRLLDFTEDEIPAQLPLWENACRLLELTEEDVRFAAEDWIPKYWDLSLHGVRKCIGAYFRELIQMTRLQEYKENGAKILYCNMPCHPACVYANKISGGANIHISHPDFLIAAVFSAFLHKETVFASGEGNSCMNPMCRHCGMNRLRADAHYKGLIASPTVLWNWGLYCDEGPKTEELIRLMGDGGWNYVLTTAPHDAYSGVNEAEDSARVDYLARQLREGQRRVSEFTGIPVSDEHLTAAMEEYLNYIRKVEYLTDLVATADPQPITSNDLTIFGAQTMMAFDTGFAYQHEAIDLMIAEVKERIAQKTGPLPAGSPSLACHFTPYCVPWVNKAFIENGINLSINTFFAPASTQAVHFDRDDIYRSVVRQWLNNPSAVNMMDEARLVSDMLKKYRPDGVLFGFFAFDRWVGSLQKTMIKLVEEETGIPHFYLEGDFWSDEKYRMEDRISRIQSIACKLKINQMVKRCNYGTKQGAQ